MTVYKEILRDVHNCHTKLKMERMEQPNLTTGKPLCILCACI